MYELRRGTMMLLVADKKSAEMYEKAGWQLIEKKSDKKDNKEVAKDENKSNGNVIRK